MPISMAPNWRDRVKTACFRILCTAIALYFFIAFIGSGISAGSKFGIAVVLSISAAIVGFWLFGFIDFDVEDELAGPPKKEVRRVRAGWPAPTDDQMDEVRRAARHAAISEAMFGKKAINPHHKDHPLFVPWAIALTEAAMELQEHQAYGPQPF